MPPLLLKLVFDRIAASPMPFFAKPIARGISEKVLNTLVRPTLADQLDFMEAELAARDWFAGGEFSAADIQMSFPLEAAHARAGLEAHRYPRTVQLIERMRERPAYQRALAKGGPLELDGF